MESASNPEAEDFEAAAQRAMEAKVAIADQVRELLVEGNPQGNRNLIATRVRQLIEAERHGETDLVRASLMELAIASLAWATRLDLRTG